MCLNRLNLLRQLLACITLLYLLTFGKLYLLKQAILTVFFIKLHVSFFGLYESCSLCISFDKIKNINGILIKLCEVLSLNGCTILFVLLFLIFLSLPSENKHKDLTEISYNVWQKEITQLLLCAVASRTIWEENCGV